jgi:hypothetical protein
MQGWRARLPVKAAGQGCQQGCRARLPSMAAQQGCQARLPSKAARQGWRARLSGKAAKQEYSVNAILKKKLQPKLRYICGEDECKDSIIEELLNHSQECGRDQVRMILVTHLFAQRRQYKKGNFFDFLSLLTNENDLTGGINWLTNSIEKELGQSSNMTTIHFIAQAGDFLSLKLLLNLLKKSMKREELMTLLNQDFEGETALHFAALEPITEDKLLVILELLASGVHGDIKNQFNETFLDGRPLLMPKLVRHLQTAQQDTIEALIDDDNTANIVKVNNDHILFTLITRGFDFNAKRDPMITIPHIWPNRENLPETFKLLCEKKVAQHNYNIDDIEIGSGKMQKEDFQEWMTEVKKYVPITFGIGYYLSRAHKGFFIGFLLLAVFFFLLAHVYFLPAI